MGEVYLAEDTKLDRKVALKILPAEVAANPERMRRFVQEAKAASALNHPNILTIHEIDQTDSINFIATEFIDGETLRDRMRKAPMKLGEVLDVAIQAASALAAAHAASIIHRDIKPENIMLRRDGIVKVLDFGLAKLTEQPVATSVDTEAPTRALMNTEPGVVMGTATYMSPEQARGLDVDARTDIFSVGVLIYEIVAGRLPFEGSNTNEILASILSDKEPLPLARYAREVPAELERIVAKALRKSCDERYQTVKDLLLDLKALKQELEFAAKLERSAPPDARVSAATASTGQSSATIKQSVASTVEVSQARPTSSAEYLVTGIKRHKLAVAIALLVLVIGAVGLSAYLHARNTEVAIESIAVLPFDNQNHDPEAEYLADGLTDSIINSLTQLPNLKVIARSSVFRYKGKQTDPIAVANELGVRAVLTGRIMQRGDHLTIGAELIDTGDNKQLWGEQYERKLSDLLSVQHEIAKEITSNLRLKLSGAAQERVTKHYTENPDAYQLYLKGRYFWDKRTGDGMSKARQSFNQAIELDPNYALAYSGLADTYLFCYCPLPRNETMPKAKAYTEKALAIDDSLAEAHTSLAFVKMNYQFDWSGAEKEFTRAIELSPNYPVAHQFYGGCLVQQGRTDQGLRECKRGLELDPLSLAINWYLGLNLYYARQYDKAMEQLRKTIQMEPNYHLAHNSLGRVYLEKGMYAEALSEFQTASKLRVEPVVSASNLAVFYAVSGNKSEAQKILDEVKQMPGQSDERPLMIARAYTALGEKDQAIEWLERAYQERAFSVFFLKVDPEFDSLRSDPHFADLMRRVGLGP
jgi:serine/threonine protein kinase/Tfp pilus assembly protein PilF